MTKIINGFKINPSTLKGQPKRHFDPKNSSDIAEYRYFLKKGTWRGTCPFELQWPYVSVPHMIAEQVAEYYVTKIAKVK